MRRAILDRASWWRLGWRRFFYLDLRHLNMTTIDLEVQGMSCGSCVKHVTQALQALTGVSGVEVDLPSGHVRVNGEFLQAVIPSFRP